MSTDSIKDIITKECQSIMNIPIGDEYQKTIDLIIEQVHNRKGKLITSGMGKAGQIAMNIATTFSSTGTPAIFLHPSEAQHGDLGIIQNNDLLLVVSNSGKTREIIELLELCKILVPNIHTISLTGNNTSIVAKSTDICIFTGNPKEVCPFGLTPTTSTTVMNVIGDILVVETMKQIGFTVEEYNKRHHGGYLGKRSLSLLGDNSSEK